MADNKIVHRVSLEGADKVSKQLDSIGDAGEKASKRVKQAFDGADLGKSGAGFGGLGKTEESAAAAERLREILHTLHPVLGAAGIELGNLGAFARVAGAGMGALGVAVVGSLLVGLAKVAEQADKTKRRLDLLSGAGRGGGESQFEGLKKIASDLGADSSDLAPAAESLFRSQQNTRSADRTVIHPDNFIAGENEQAAGRVQVFKGADATPAGGVSSETINAAIKASAEAGRLDRTSAKDSAAALASLYESTKGGKGQVTVDAYDALVKASPAIGDAVAKAASGSGAGGVGQGLPAGAPDLRAFLQRGGKLSGDQVLTGLARTEPELRGQAEAVPPGITESFDHLEAAAKRVAEAFAGDSGIVGAVDKLAEIVNAAADNVDKQLLHPRDYEPGGKKFIGPVSPEEKKKYNTPDILDIGKTLLTGESDERFKDSNAIKATKFLRDGPELLQGPVSEPLDVLNKIVNNPGALQSPERPEASGPVSPATAPFAAVPFQKLQQRELELQRLRDLPQQRQPEQHPPGQLESPAPAPSPIAAPAAPPATSPDVDATPLYRPLTGPAKSPEFDYIPPPTPDQQRQLDLDRLRGPQQPSQQLPFPPPPQFDRTNFGQAEPGPSEAPLAVQPVSYQQQSPPQQGALPLQPPSIVQDVAGFVQNIINSASEKLNGPQNRTVETPAATIGIRGEAAPVGDDAAQRQVADLGAAAEEAAAKLRGVAAPARTEAPVDHAAEGGQLLHMAAGGEARLDVSPGGRLKGPGTGKSDSIDAKVANGEFVVNAEDTAKNLDLLHDINSGKDVSKGYADGGKVQKLSPDGRPDNDESGVIEASDGNFYPYHSKAEKDDILRGIDKASQDAQSSQGKKKHHSMFHPMNDGAGSFGFAAGGLVGEFAPHFAKGGTVTRASFADRVSAMGLSSIDVPHLAIGGVPEIAHPALSEDSSMFKNGNGKSAGDVPHHTVDLRTDHGTFRMMSPEQTVKQLNASAQSAKRSSTGSKPNWYGGGGR